jgi:hypothetical protein
MSKHPYAVRETTSGYNGVTKYLVVRNPGGKRVSVHASVTREGAQASADDLNRTVIEDDPYIGDAIEGYRASEMAAYKLRTDPVWRAMVWETERAIRRIDEELAKDKAA